MTHHLVIPSKEKALLGWLRGNTQASVNQSKPKGKEEKVTGKKAEESAEQYIREAVAWEECSVFCLTTMSLTWWMAAVLLWVDALVA